MEKTKIRVVGSGTLLLDSHNVKTKILYNESNKLMNMDEVRGIVKCTPGSCHIYFDEKAESVVKIMHKINQILKGE